MVTFLEDLQQGLHALFAEDERVILLGEDVLDSYGGAFKVTKGLSGAYPQRVMTTPISEAGIVGVGTGMALRGLRPIVEIMFGDFLSLTADQIINYATKFRAMYNGQVTVPLVVRTPMGGGRGYGPTHSQTLEKLFLGIPYLRIVAPSLYHRPGEMLRQATLYDDGVVLFLEHKLLYPARLVTADSPPISVEMRNGVARYPTMFVRNFERGKPDVAVICYGGATLLIHPLLARLAEEEIRVLVCAPACIHPLPEADLVEAARAAGRVVVVEEGTGAFGWGAEVAATLSAEVALDTPVRRVAAQDTVIPAARELERLVLPSTQAVEDAIYEALA